MSADLLSTFASITQELGYLTPIGPALVMPADPVVVAVSFTGTRQGRLLVAADHGLTIVLARNLLAAEGDILPELAMDAVRELANVLAGNLLPMMLGEGEYHLDQPERTVWPDGLSPVIGLECLEGTLVLGGLT